VLKVIAAVAVFVGIAAGIWWFVSRTTPPPPERVGAAPPSVTIASFDEYNRELAKRVTDVLLQPGGAPDFQVVVTQAEDPIGTLYQKGRSVAFDDKACVPAQEPTPRGMPNAFPAYTFDANVAFDAGLDPALFQGIADVSTRLSSASSVKFSILDAQRKSLADTDLQQLLRTAACAGVVRRDVLIVRGYIIGKRHFSTNAKRTGTATLSGIKAAKFVVDDSAGGLLSITDEAPRQFLQILSEISAPPPSTGGNASAAPDVSAPSPVSGEGRIYVQQAEADTPVSGSQIVSLLQADGFKVESRVERTADKVTPDRAQVRYFNEADKERAMQVLETFKQKYPDAVLVPLKIRAPLGQLEVWLPRVKTSLPARATTPAPPRATIPLSPRRGTPLSPRRGTTPEKANTPSKL